MKCPYDGLDCKHYNSGSMDIECKDCCRYFDGCKATGSAKFLDWLRGSFKKKTYPDMDRYAKLEDEFYSQG
jgi:hypothetical protein